MYPHNAHGVQGLLLPSLVLIATRQDGPSIEGEANLNQYIAMTTNS